MSLAPPRLAPADPSSWDTFYLTHLLPPGEGGLCLDLGCGPGARNTLTALGYTYLGFDKFRTAGADLIGDAADLPLADNSIDLLIAASSFEHFPDPWKVSREVFRVLKPGCSAVVSLSFLEPYHAHSYFHFSHLGAARLFESAGLVVTALEPFEWNGPEASAQAIFQLRPVRWLTALLVRPTLWLRRIVIRCLILGLKDQARKARAIEFLEEETFRFTAGIKLRATKPGRAAGG